MLVGHLLQRAFVAALNLLQKAFLSGCSMPATESTFACSQGCSHTHVPCSTPVYGAEAWRITKQLERKFESPQRAMERRMIGVMLREMK